MKRSVELSDPRALRALAHPLRLSLLGLLRREGPLTATEAGERVGESPASCSFHLRQLAKHGLVEEAGGGRGRRRPWRATALLTSWRTQDVSGDAAAAAGTLSRVLAQRYLVETLEWLDREPFEPRDWREASGLGDLLLYLTLDELRDFKERLEALVAPYEARIEDRERRPPGSRGVSFLHAIFPHAEGG